MTCCSVSGRHRTGHSSGEGADRRSAMTGSQPGLFRSASFSTNTLRILAAAAYSSPGSRLPALGVAAHGNRSESADRDTTRTTSTKPVGTCRLGGTTCRNLVEAATRMRHDQRQTPAHSCTQHHHGEDRPQLVCPGQSGVWLVRRSAPGSAPGRIRTCDLRIRSPSLYPLSYGRSAAGAFAIRSEDYRLITPIHDRRTPRERSGAAGDYRHCRLPV